MSNKLIKNNKSTDKNKKEQKEIIALSVVDIVLTILLTILLIIQSKINLINISNTDINLQSSVKIILVSALIIIWLLIAIIFGIYQDKVEGIKTNISSGFKELKRQSDELTQKDRLLNILNSIMRIYVITSCGIICDIKMGIILIIIGIIITILFNILHKFKIGDIGYTIYTIGAISCAIALIY